MPSMISRKLSLDDRPMRAPEVRWRSVGDDLLLVHTLLKQYHVLNAVAGRIWELATGDESAGQIADRIASEYGHDRDQVLLDVTDTIEGFRALQLLTIVPPSP
jgi:hypothetical protein